MTIDRTSGCTTSVCDTMLTGASSTPRLRTYNRSMGSSPNGLWVFGRFRQVNFSPAFTLTESNVSISAVGSYDTDKFSVLVISS